MKAGVDVAYVPDVSEHGHTHSTCTGTLFAVVLN